VGFVSSITACPEKSRSVTSRRSSSYYRKEEIKMVSVYVLIT